MKKNMGSTDRVIRILIAFIVTTLYFVNVISGALAIVLLLFSAIFMLSSMVSFCPLYVSLGINTAKGKNKVPLFVYSSTRNKKYL